VGSWEAGRLKAQGSKLKEKIKGRNSQHRAWGKEREKLGR
jgi:hypothetical protein